MQPPNLRSIPGMAAPGMMLDSQQAADIEKVMNEQRNIAGAQLAIQSYAKEDAPPPTNDELIERARRISLFIKNGA